MKVLIIGGVAGGASAAARLRRLDEDAQIILLERGGYISYANCGLPYYIGGEIADQGQLTLQTPESFWRRFRIDVRIYHEALRIDRESRRVSIWDRRGNREYEESYDKLILSPGAEPVCPPVPGLKDERVFTLRTIPDTLAIRRFIEERRPRRAVIVGGGYIGVEMAENLTRAGLQVSIVELSDHLIGPLDYDMACDVHRYLSQKGVEILLRNGVEGVEPAPDGLTVRLQRGERAADLVLLCVGVRPESRLAREAGLELTPKGAVRVNAHMQTSDPDIYAVGDVTAACDYVSGNPVHIPLAGPANKQGRIAAGHICGLPHGYRGTQGSSVLKLFDMTVAMSGLNERAAKEAGYSYDKVYLFSPSHATYYPGAENMSLKVLFERESGRILGCQITGFEGVDKRCDVLATAIRAGMAGEDLADLELCYAPPFSSAKDPVNMAGFVIQNLLEGNIRQFHWQDVASLPRDGSATLLDVRTPTEYARGHIAGAVNIPLDELREHLDGLDSEKPVYVNCQSGLRSYIACRILSQHGFTCSHLAGGYRLYESVTAQPEFDGRPVHPCGLPVSPAAPKR